MTRHPRRATAAAPLLEHEHTLLEVFTTFHDALPPVATGRWRSVQLLGDGLPLFPQLDDPPLQLITFLHRPSGATVIIWRVRRVRRVGHLTRARAQAFHHLLLFDERGELACGSGSVSLNAGTCQRDKRRLGII